MRKPRQDKISCNSIKPDKDRVKKNGKELKIRTAKEKFVLQRSLYAWDCWPNCIVRIEIPVE